MPGTVALKYPVPSLAIPNEFDYSRFENELFSADLFRIGNFEQAEFQLAGNVRFGCVRPAENVRLHALFLASTIRTSSIILGLSKTFIYTHYFSLFVIRTNSIVVGLSKTYAKVHVFCFT